MFLIIGSNGQLGREMQRILAKRKEAFCAYDYPDIDITRADGVEKLINDAKPACVINCAAYTNVDQAESDADLAYAVNALGPKYLAQICQKKDIELVHVSTDYVFSGEPVLASGKPRPYIETDTCSPLTVYGKTKLEGEEFVREFHNRYYILRTAWLYGDGNNFVKTMLKLAQSRDSLTVVNDQFGSPTSTVDLGGAIYELTGTGLYGTYHATCEGQCTWFEFAKKIFEITDMHIEVAPVSSEQFIRPAKRPKWSVLENFNLKQAGKNAFRTWEEALVNYLSR